MASSHDIWLCFSPLDEHEEKKQAGWVSILKYFLEISLSDALGKTVELRVFPAQTGETEEVYNFNPDSIMLLIMSPDFLASEDCSRRLDAFLKGDVVRNPEERVFKIIKEVTDAGAEPAELRELPSYSFFRPDPHRPALMRKFEPGPEAPTYRDYWDRLEQLVYDISRLVLEQNDEEGESPAVYLARCRPQFQNLRNSLRRELEQIGCRILPDVPDANDEPVLALHLTGTDYWRETREGDSSLDEREAELTGAWHNARRIFWMPRGAQAPDEEQARFLENVQADKTTELLRVSADDLTNHVRRFMRERPPSEDSHPGIRHESENPFPGPRPFESDDSPFFFGREHQVREIIARLRQSPLLLLLGPAGAGKTSVLQAGVVPAIQSGALSLPGECTVITLTPGRDPLDSLAGAVQGAVRETPYSMPEEIELPVPVSGDQARRILAGALLRRGATGLLALLRRAGLLEGGSLLLVVDAFEQLFQFERGEDETARLFMEHLRETAHHGGPNVRIILSMRSDYLTEFAEVDAFSDVLNRGTYSISPPTREEARAAITGPVARVGTSIPPSMINGILNDYQAEAPPLSLLQHGLRRAYEKGGHNGSGVLEPESLMNAVNLRRNLNQYAEDAFARLPDEYSRRVAEKVFKALTLMDSANRCVNTPVRVTDLSVIAQTTETLLLKVLEHYTSPEHDFLVTSDGLSLESVVELRYPYLMIAWRRLKAWMEKEKQSAALYRNLSRKTDLYLRGKGPLLKPPNLEVAALWRRKSWPGQIWAERYAPNFADVQVFVDQSEHAWQEEQTRENKQKALERRTGRLRRKKRYHEAVKPHKKAIRNLKFATIALGITTGVATIAAVLGFIF